MRWWVVDPSACRQRWTLVPDVATPTVVGGGMDGTDGVAGVVGVVGDPQATATNVSPAMISRSRALM